MRCSERTGRATSRRAALVTNLAVHFKWGRESSRVWVTALDTGRPVRGAAIRISGYCSDDTLWKGDTDADGIASVSRSLGEPHGDDGCSRWSPEPLIVSARSDERHELHAVGLAARHPALPNSRSRSGWGGEAADVHARRPSSIAPAARRRDGVDEAFLPAATCPAGLRMPGPDASGPRARC